MQNIVEFVLNHSCQRLYTRYHNLWLRKFRLHPSLSGTKGNSIAVSLAQYFHKQLPSENNIENYNSSARGIWSLPRWFESSVCLVNVIWLLKVSGYRQRHVVFSDCNITRFKINRDGTLSIRYDSNKILEIGTHFFDNLYATILKNITHTCLNRFRYSLKDSFCYSYYYHQRLSMVSNRVLFYVSRYCFLQIIFKTLF